MPRDCSLVTYNTRRENFESVYERNKFYRGLFGYKQTVKRNGKTYEYEKDGIMDEIPHARIDDSVFIVPEGEEEKMREYFLEWSEKVSHHIFTVTVEDEDLIERIESEDNNTTGEL
jgi:hypothetical protein